jgi:beta-galactosidase
MRFSLITVLFLWPISVVTAQVGTPTNGHLPSEGRAPWRTEFISYDITAEATSGELAGSKYYRDLAFSLSSTADTPLYEATLDIHPLWLDRAVYIRDTGRTGRYALVVNGERVGYNTDSYGTAEWYVTPYLREGENRFEIRMMGLDTVGGDMERFEASSPQRLTSIYLFSQPRIHIFDYIASGHHDDEFKDNIIDLGVIVVNDYNMPETVRVGYDVWDPVGNLKEYAFREVEIPGRGCDTVWLRNKVTGTHRYQYSAANPALYRVTLNVRHGGRFTEYIPLRLGFGLTSWDGERVSRGGEPIEIRSEEGDFPVQKGTLEKLRALKKRGINTIALTRPQQKWFYEMAATEGMYIIDRAAVECDPKGDNRSIGGTVANAPDYLPRFLDRQAAMFYRGRNYPNIIGWSIGSPSGNGYNMYKSYQLLKSLDPTRPVVYTGAEGEFNSDLR